MSYKIIGDSCMDLTEDTKKKRIIQLVPLTLEVGDETIVDDSTFDQLSFLQKIRYSVKCPRSACPSPQAYLDAIEGEEDMVFIVTLSGNLSGSYNSAVVAKQMYEEEHEGSTKKIHVFNSRSACAGEGLIALTIRDLAEEGRSFEEIVEKTEDYLKNMHTYFVVETLDFLKKNGRLTGLAAMLATALNIKPVMGAKDGVIVKLDQTRGMKKALEKMCAMAIQEAKGMAQKRISITHCNCPERAEQVRQFFLSHLPAREVIVVNAAGVSSLYAGQGGIVVSM